MIAPHRDPFCVGLLAFGGLLGDHVDRIEAERDLTTLPDETASFIRETANCVLRGELDEYMGMERVVGHFGRPCLFGVPEASQP